MQIDQEKIDTRFDATATFCWKQYLAIGPSQKKESDGKIWISIQRR